MDRKPKLQGLGVMIELELFAIFMLIGVILALAFW